MAIPLASAFVELSLKGVSSIIGGIGGVGGAFRAMGSSAMQATSQVRGFVDSITSSLNPLNHLNELLLGLGATVGAAGVLRLGAGAETQLTQFGVLLRGNTELAKEFYDSIIEFSDVTPFTAAALIPISKQLMGYGLAADKIIPKMKQLGDIASMVENPEESLGAFSRAYGQAFMTKRVGGGVLEVFREKGVPIMQELAKVMKVPGENVLMLEKYIADGRVPLAALDLALYNLTKAGGQYADGTKKLSETTSGLWSTLVSKVETNMRKVGTAMIAGFNVKGVLTSAINFMEGLWERHGGKVIAVFQAIGGFARNVWQGISDGLNKAWTIISDIWPDMTRLGAKGQSVFEEWGTAIGIAIGSLIEGIAKLVEHLSDTGFLDTFMEAMGILAGAVMVLARTLEDMTPDPIGFGEASKGMFKNIQTEGLTEEEKNLIPGYKKRKREEAKAELARLEEERNNRGRGDYSGDRGKGGGGDFGDEAPPSFTPLPMGKVGFTSISGLWEKMQEQASAMALMNQQLTAQQGTAEATKSSAGSLVNIDRNMERLANRPSGLGFSWA